MNDKEIIAYLKRALSRRRFEHTMSTAEMAKKLAQIYQVDSAKAYTAGLLHDAAKELSSKEMTDYILKGGMRIDAGMKNNPALLHAYAGAVMVKYFFSINDEEIAEAVKYHTTGKADMTMLQKIIFVADAVEETRVYDKRIAQWREQALTDIDAAMLQILNYNIIKVVKRDFYLHENTVQARNFILAGRDGK